MEADFARLFEGEVVRPQEGSHEAMEWFVGWIRLEETQEGFSEAVWLLRRDSIRYPSQWPETALQEARRQVSLIAKRRGWSKVLHWSMLFTPARLTAMAKLSTLLVDKGFEEPEGWCLSGE